MCGRFTLAKPGAEDLRARFNLGESVRIEQRYNVAPGDPVLSVVRARDGETRGELLRWGLVPHWADSPSLGVKTINARAETVAQRPAYRDAFARRRCLIVADGFYEWERRDDGTKQPWWITRADGAAFAFAGVWASWHGEGHDRPLRTCAIVTTAANAACRPIHPRMPVMLERAGEPAWLAPDAPPEDLHALLAAPPDDAVARRPVSTAVNDARYDGPECLAEPVDAGGAASPGSLF